MTTKIFFTLHVPDATALTPFYQSPRDNNLHPTMLEYYRFAIADYLNYTYPHIEIWPLYDLEFKEKTPARHDELFNRLKSHGSKATNTLIRLQIG